MRDDITHRGPDDCGTVVFTRNGSGYVPAGEDCGWSVGLANRRLSILDLSQNGHQPMEYRGIWVTYNGEIYNFQELRQELTSAGHLFRSTCDTEVLLAAYAEWGTACFQKFRGMWGIILFDAIRGKAFCCRDRLGIKPLYHWTSPDTVAVVSEIKQLLRLPGFRPRADEQALSEYLSTTYEDPSRSLFADVVPVPPGTFLEITLKPLSVGRPQSYWNPESIRPTIVDVAQAADLFAAKFSESVKLHLRSDVPVGCALSGGTDSTAIASVIQHIPGRDSEALHAFTVTFPQFNHDERKYVEAANIKLRAITHFVQPSPELFLSDLQRFVWIHDEPVAGLSIYAAYCLARLTRTEGISVTLNGQGGDELLGGYWQSYAMYLRDLVRNRQLGTLWGQIAGTLSKNGNAGLLARMPALAARYWHRAHGNSKLVRRRCSAGADNIFARVLNAAPSSRRLLELRFLLLPRLLKWEDRNSCAFSVEGRYPFLDHELVETCLSFAPSTLFDKGWTKRPLRVGLAGILPPEVAARKTKFGFEVPQAEWLRGPLRPILSAWLNGDRFLWNYVDKRQVQSMANSFWERGAAIKGERLFCLFMADQWAQRYGLTG